MNEDESKEKPCKHAKRVTIGMTKSQRHWKCLDCGHTWVVTFKSA